MASGRGQVREQPGDEPIDGEVISVDPPRALIHRWAGTWCAGGSHPPPSVALLTLEQTMQQRDPAAMNAAGWDVCLTVLDEVLGGADTPRATGPAALERAGRRCATEYVEALAYVD